VEEAAATLKFSGKYGGASVPPEGVKVMEGSVVEAVTDTASLKHEFGVNEVEKVWAAPPAVRVLVAGVTVGVKSGSTTFTISE